MKLFMRGFNAGSLNRLGYQKHGQASSMGDVNLGYMLSDIRV